MFNCRLLKQVLISFQTIVNKEIFVLSSLGDYIIHSSFKLMYIQFKNNYQKNDHLFRKSSLVNY